MSSVSSGRTVGLTSRSDRPPKGSAVSVWPVPHPPLPSLRGLGNELGIESTGGFELAIELKAKGFRRSVTIAEVPTMRRDRTAGMSRFRLMKCLPKYLYWYSYALASPPGHERTR